MSNLIRLLVCCTILVLSDGSNCPQQDPTLGILGSSVIYTRHFNGTLTSTSISCTGNYIFSPTELKCVEVKQLDERCTRVGRMLDTNSKNCTSYLICTRLKDGSFTANQAKCPNRTVFSPDVRRCVSNKIYTCPENREILQSSECFANGRFADPNSMNCSSYLICTQLENGNYTSSKIMCPSGMIFSSNVSRCISNERYSCPVYKNLRQNGCKANGRLPDPTSSNCSSYFICTRLENGNFSLNQVTCPSGTLFSRNVNRCISINKYNCPTIKHDPQNNECYANGRFLEKNSTNCTSYKICIQLKDGSYHSKLITCPTGTLFSPIVNRCVSNSTYVCPGYLDAAQNALQTNKCNGSGRFLDPESINCSSYLRCNKLNNGSYSSNKVTCPTGTIFSSNVSRCISNTSYVPGHVPGYRNEIQQSIDNGCRGNGRFSDPTSLNCSSYLVCTQLEDGTYSLKQVACPIGTLYSSKDNRCVSNSIYNCPENQIEPLEDRQSSKCFRNGRIPDPYSSNCSSYLICSKFNNGRYTSNQINCPNGTIFSPKVNRCILSSDYTCYSCNKEGLFPDPNSIDCSTYISCSKDLIPETLKCPQYTLFSAEQNSCIIACDVTCQGALVHT